MERWPSGLRRTLGKRVYGNVPWVRIPPSPQTCVKTSVCRHLLLEPANIYNNSWKIMWYVYCLENESEDYLYVGSTSDLRRRLNQHNAGLSPATKPYIPLSVVAYIAVTSESKARRLEKYLKSGSGKAILKKRILQTNA